MRTFIVTVVALSFISCAQFKSTFGEYAGLDLSIGVTQQFGQDRYRAFQFSEMGQGQGKGHSNSSLYFDGETEEKTYLGFGATVLIRPDND